eukprot:gene16568-16749_t
MTKLQVQTLALPFLLTFITLSVGAEPVLAAGVDHSNGNMIGPIECMSLGRSGLMASSAMTCLLSEEAYNGAESPSDANVIASIFPSDLSPNAVVGVRTGLPNFTARERSAILDDAVVRFDGIFSRRRSGAFKDRQNDRQMTFRKSCNGLTIDLGSSTERTLNHCFFYDILRQPMPDYATPLLPLGTFPVSHTVKNSGSVSTSPLRFAPTEINSVLQLIALPPHHLAELSIPSPRTSIKITAARILNNGRSGRSRHLPRNPSRRDGVGLGSDNCDGLERVGALNDSTLRMRRVVNGKAPHRRLRDA